MEQSKLEIKTGSQEEIDMLERLESKRIASAERKWKIELRDKRVGERRRDIMDHLQRNDGIAFAFWMCIIAITLVSCICMIRCAWHVWQ